jgi:hypothetical protein
MCGKTIYVGPIQNQGALTTSAMSSICKHQAVADLAAARFAESAPALEDAPAVAQEEGEQALLACCATLMATVSPLHAYAYVWTYDSGFDCSILLVLLVRFRRHAPDGNCSASTISDVSTDAPPVGMSEIAFIVR